MPHIPQELGVPLHEGASPALSLPPEEANTESFFESRVEPQWGHSVPFHSIERTRISLSRSHFPQ